MSESLHQSVYTKDVLEFVTVASEYCGFLEIATQNSSDEFLDKLSKLLPLLYLKTSMVTKPESIFDEGLEQFVTEEQYHAIANGIVSLVGASDDYLEVFHPDIQYSDGPVRATVSENLADIYQHLKDFTTVYQLGSEEIMNDAVNVIIQEFEDTWGQKLTNVLRAIHSLKHADKDDIYEEQLPKEKKGNFYTNLQKQWGEDFNE